MNTILELNSRGALTLPKSLRRLLGVEHGGRIIAETSDQGVLLRPGVAFPIEIYTDARMAEFDAAEEDLKKHLKRRAK
jgi:bifunctional DNA-binding transcriptional regulator/antitoxin component of YhaV-PrlF toxin-antitoxin module